MVKLPRTCQHCGKSLMHYGRCGCPASWTPTEAGFFWAKWKIASDGTREADELTPSDRWEVVEVVTNHIDRDDPEYLMVSVCGVEKNQPLDGFFWGEEVHRQSRERFDASSQERKT